MSERTIELIINLTSSIRFFLWSALGVVVWFTYNTMAPVPLRIDDPKAWLFLNLWFGLFGYFQGILLLHNQRRQDEALMGILRMISDKEGAEEAELARLEVLLRQGSAKRKHTLQPVLLGGD
jgi:uncharacterized membrane protein